MAHQQPDHGGFVAQSLLGREGNGGRTWMHCLAGGYVIDCPGLPGDPTNRTGDVSRWRIADGRAVIGRTYEFIGQMVSGEAHIASFGTANFRSLPATAYLMSRGCPGMRLNTRRR